jgi:hypothetical protein
MANDRNMARFGQGATMSVNGIDLSRDFTELTPGEIALLVARHMFEGAENGVFPYSVESSLAVLWPGRDTTLKFRRRIIHFLMSNGFLPSADPRGWTVPNPFPDWKNDETVKVHRHAKDQGRADQAAKSGPVTTEFGCRECGERFPTPSDLGAHVAHVHAKPWVCDLCGFNGNTASAGGHMKSHSISPLQQTLLDAIKARPGMHPRDYATLLGTTAGAISSLAAYLVRRGLVEVSGNRQTRCYWAAGNRPREKDAAAVELGSRGGKKGGPARAKALTDEEREEIARKAANTRWKRDASPAPKSEELTLRDDHGNKYVVRDGKVYREKVITTYEEVK